MRPGRTGRWRLEEDAAANLDDALVAATSGDLSERGAVHRRGRDSKVDEVEDVGDLAAKLEFQRLVQVERTDERGIDVPVTGIVKLHGAGVSKQAEGTY